VIAIVDDDPSVLKALARVLRARALDPKTFGSAREFLASLTTEMPECLIADLQMPGMTGLELQHNLNREGIRIPTIIITAHDETGVRKRCEAAGAVAFLAKPVQDTALLAAIDDARRGSRNKDTPRPY
jgi:FixJ family two-component response regulator